METITIHCPLGNCHSAVELQYGVGVHQINAYKDDPETPVGYDSPDPAKKVGQASDIPLDKRSSVPVSCTNEHHLEVIVGKEMATKDTCIYGPVRKERIRCPECKFDFGDRNDHIVTTPGPDGGRHKINSVTTELNAKYHETETLRRGTLQQYDHVAKRKECPHCGTLLAFNYEKNV